MAKKKKKTKREPKKSLHISENPPKGSGTPPPEIEDKVKEQEPRRVIVDEAKQI